MMNHKSISFNVEKNMKKTILATSIAVSLGVVAPAAHAAFTPLAAGNYTASITGGCFEFGNCQTTGNGVFSGNTAGEAVFNLTAGMPTATARGTTVGSGVTTAGDHGEIKFSLDGSGNMTITSYRQNSYLATAGGTFYVDANGAAGVGSMGGTIDGTGNMVFDPTGREGMAAAFATGIGVQPWNNSKKFTPTAYDTFSTGTRTNASKGASAAWTVTGTPLADAGAGTWTGILVATGNINGDYWSGFNNVQYTEIFNLTITADASAVPVPAAAWLFGSGLLGLVGVARRKKMS
jgi:hypothetical protein